MAIKFTSVAYIILQTCKITCTLFSKSLPQVYS